jgi:hypothetical protein
MMLDGHVENGNIVLDESASLPEGAKVRIEVLAEKNSNASEPLIPTLYDRPRHVIGKINTAAEDSGCFQDLAPARPLDAGAKESLRILLTQKQYAALVDIVDRGGPDVDAIRRLRAASMT